MAHHGRAGKPPIFILLKLKCYSMTADLKLHCQACCCDLQVLENSSAQLQQQLAQKCTELSSAEESLASLQHELSQAQLCKYEATKVNLVVCLHHGNFCITAVAHPPSRCMLCRCLFILSPSALRVDYLYCCSCLSSIKMYAVPTRLQFLSLQR